jgi:copper chaperone
MKRIFLFTILLLLYTFAEHFDLLGQPSRQTGDGHQKATLNVKGMSCNGCVRTITKAVKKLDGVEDVKAQLEERIVEIEFDSSKVSLRRIEEEISKMGYKPIRRSELKVGTPGKGEENKNDEKR